MKINLQQLAGIIDDEDLLIEKVLKRKLYEKFNFNDIVGTSIKLLNEPIVQEQEHINQNVLNNWVEGNLPESFKISKSLDPREEVTGGLKWNANLNVDNLLWDNPIFEGKPVVEVTGNFVCYKNKLTSLEGAPKTVTGDFLCANNELTSLEGAPKTVGGYLNCAYNKLTSLEGAPETVGQYLNCTYNKLTSLEGAPKTVGGNFYCSNNPDLPQDEIPDTKIGRRFIN